MSSKKFRQAARTWRRQHLSAIARGLAMQPLNQPIEMIDRDRQSRRGSGRYKRITALTGGDWQATFYFRAGYATEAAAASPRRRLRDDIEDFQGRDRES